MLTQGRTGQGLGALAAHQQPPGFPVHEDWALQQQQHRQLWLLPQQLLLLLRQFQLRGSRATAS
jgi:hypothetical protein